MCACVCVCACVYFLHLQGTKDAGYLRDQNGHWWLVGTAPVHHVWWLWWWCYHHGAGEGGVGVGADGCLGTVAAVAVAVGGVGDVVDGDVDGGGVGGVVDGDGVVVAVVVVL